MPKVGVEGSGHESVTTIVRDNKKRKVRGQTVAGWWKLMISSRCEKGGEGKRAEEREREGEMAVRSI